MRYTQNNLEAALRHIDPESFDIYKNEAKLNLPDLMDRMFVKGFSIYIDSGFIPLNDEEKSIIWRAYNNLHGSPGYFKFEPEL